MPEEVADDFKRDTALQQMHALGVAQSVRTYRLSEAGMIAGHGLDVPL